MQPKTEAAGLAFGNYLSYFLYEDGRFLTQAHYWTAYAVKVQEPFFSLKNLGRKLDY